MPDLKNHSPKSQCMRILSYLQLIGPLSSRDIIFRFNCIRPAARIADLREEGWPIETTMVYEKKNGVTVPYAIYSLRKDAS